MDAWLVSISRGFGGDNAYYKERGSGRPQINVAVNWALLHPFLTEVFVDGKKVAEFTDREYVQPHVALARLGYTVHGTVDFAEMIAPEHGDLEAGRELLHGSEADRDGNEI